MPYCLNCQYDLREAEGACPECGRSFSLSRPDTYAEHQDFKKRKVIKRIKIAVWLLIIYLVLGSLEQLFWFPYFHVAILFIGLVSGAAFILGMLFDPMRTNHVLMKLRHYFQR